MLYKSLFFLSILLIGATASPILYQAESPEVREAQIDSLFVSWNGTDVPGGAIAVVQGGRISFQKAYGMASLEYGVPNRTETIFNLASVSKQFTAYGIVLLEEQGKLSLEDDVRKHLPDVPDFGEPITIRNMLNHTSGLRSLHALLGMAGWREDDRRSNADLRRFIAQQEELNFSPGSEYLYCNTGYMFCADIIENISGQTYEDWMQQNVFEPLGMKHSFARRNINQVVPNVATSYYESGEDGFEKAIEYWAYIGSGNMHSTLDDLAKWMQQFRDPSPGIQKLMQNGILTNGDTIPYALGINVTTYRGQKVINHGGSIGGYRSFLAYFPEHDLGFIVLSNRSSANAGGKAYQLAQLYLKDHLSTVSRPSRTQEEEEPPAWYPSKKDRNAFLGRYYSPELDTYYSLLWDTENGYQAYHQRHNLMPLNLAKKDELEIRGGQLRFRLERDKRNRVTGLRASNGRVRNLWFEKVE